MGIIAVAGGKGGVGKTILSTNLSICLAKTGQSTVLIDLDLGGANVNTAFGHLSASPSLREYFEKTKTLDEILIPTQEPHLSFISCAGDSSNMANPKYAKKLSLIKAIGRMKQTHIVIDLGAGTRFDTLDFFLSAQQHVLITTTDITSLFNVYGFIKSAVIRRVERTLKKDFKIVELNAVEILKQALQQEGSFMEYFFERLRKISIEATNAMETMINGLNWYVVTNRLDTGQTMDAHMALNNLCKKNLGFVLLNGGEMFFDKEVQASVNQMQPYMLGQRSSATARTMVELAMKIQSRA
jgi:flagellar biosynthesis protein FlhG